MSFATEAATDSTFYPYTGSAYGIYSGVVEKNGQFWYPSNMITLSVSANSAVYLTNYTSSWYGEAPNLGDSDYAAGYDMSANKYGYVYAKIDEDGKASPVGDVHWADGETIEVTYKNPTGPQTRTTTGYLLGTFKNNAEIFFVMTPNGYEETVNSYDPVNDPDGLGYESILASRQVNTEDQSVLVRVNFGTVDGVGHEFVVGSIALPPDGGGDLVTGQPLPSMLLCGLLSLGTLTATKRLRKRSRK